MNKRPDTQLVLTRRTICVYCHRSFFTLKSVRRWLIYLLAHCSIQNYLNSPFPSRMLRCVLRLFGKSHASPILFQGWTNLWWTDYRYIIDNAMYRTLFLFITTRDLSGPTRFHLQKGYCYWLRTKIRAFLFCCARCCQMYFTISCVASMFINNRHPCVRQFYRF